MFCPNCGLDEKQPNQFCRACGTNLRPIRQAAEIPDSVTGSAISAREEIGHAVALKIREVQSVNELKKVAEDVLPEIEKFLESPEEKRLRRLRSGTIVSSIGVGAGICLSLVAVFSRNEDLLFLAGLGGITFFIGLGIVINALLFTIPKKMVPDRAMDADRQRTLDAATDGLKLPDSGGRHFTSVTEHTTRHLEKDPVERT